MQRNGSYRSKSGSGWSVPKPTLMTQLGSGVCIAAAETMTLLTWLIVTLPSELVMGDVM